MRRPPGTRLRGVARDQYSSVEALVRELDVLIRARYPLAVSTFEEQRFRRLMAAVSHLERHAPKGLYAWSRTTGLRQLLQPGLGTTSGCSRAPKIRCRFWITSLRPSVASTSSVTLGRTLRRSVRRSRSSFVASVSSRGRSSLAQ